MPWVSDKRIARLEERTRKVEEWEHTLGHTLTPRWLYNALVDTVSEHARKLFATTSELHASIKALQEDNRKLRFDLQATRTAVFAQAYNEGDDNDRIDALQTEVDLRMKARISSILQVNSKLSKLSEALGLIWDPEKGDYVANKPKKATRKAK